MELQTPIEMPPQPRPLTSDSRVLLLGSCFAQEVGVRLQHQMPDGQVVVNPLGPQYSPEVLAHTLRGWLRGVPELPPFEGRDRMWHSWQASSVCSATTQEECVRLLHEAWEQGREALLSATHIVLTFGTTRYYRLADAADNQSGQVVANCHKELSTRFREEEPSLEALIADWQALIAELHALPQRPEVILTVSPYRYRKYGYHTSQLHKARLLLLCDALKDAPGAPHYFPSYELLLDELRDYRFYAPDMLHPSEQAVDYIADRFREWAFAPELLREADERLREWRRRQHRPLM